MEEPQPLADDLDQRLVLHLRRQGWTLPQIAALVERGEDTVLQVSRDPLTARASAVPVSSQQQSASVLRVRLNHNAQKMQIWLPADTLPMSTEALLVLIQEECSRRKIAAVLTYADLEQRMRIWVYGTWLTVLEATPPVPATPGRVHLLVPVTVAQPRARHAPCLVRSGTALARLEPGTPGKPGRDLLGRVDPPRQPRTVQLPQGEHTRVSQDGTLLIADIDGRAVLRNLRIHVIPQVVHEGDLTETAAALKIATGVIVTGSVLEGAVLEAESDIHVQLGVRSARISCTQGSIRVDGAIAGGQQLQSILRAGQDIFCGRVSHTVLEAHGDILVQGEVHYSKLVVGGDLHLSRSLERSLFEVELSVGGSVIVPIAPFSAPTDPPRERQHTRVPLTLNAQLALYGTPPLVFTPVVIEDLSPAGARCRLIKTLPAVIAPEMTVELKFHLPGSTGLVVIIARVVRQISPNEIGIAFLQITERDVNRVMRFCLDELRKLKDFQPGSHTTRR